MAWFRLHEGTSLDVKWPLIARKAETNVGTVVAVWTAVLDYASQQQERGSIAGFDCEAIDAFYGFEDGVCQRVFDAMVAKGMIKDGKITNWEKRQPKKEDENAASRKQQQREREKNAKTPEVTNVDAQSQPVTQCHDASHDVTLDKIRIEENIKGNLKNPPISPPGGTGGDAPSVLQEPDFEFATLRATWNTHMRSEGPRAGFKAYLALKKARAWPGIALIEHDIMLRKEAGAWSPGYEPGLEKYLGDRTWDAPLPTSRASPQTERKTYAQLEQEDWEKRLREAEEYDRQRKEAEDGKTPVLAQAG